MTPALNLLIDVFGSEPLLIRDGGADLLVARAMALITKTPKVLGGRYIAGPGRHYPRQGANWDGPIEMPGMTIQDGIAEIPIQGVIGAKLDPLAKWYFDACDVMDVQREMAQAEADPNVSSILFTVDSPGGSSRGVAETADLMADLSKPAASWVDGMACSAGYWMPAAAGPIYATRGSDIGSIGAYSVFYDKSKLYADFGVTAQVFASGKYKGAGVPGTSLTREQADYIQADVNELAAEFKSAVREKRGDVSEDMMEGQSMTAGRAKNARLIDGIHKSKAAMIEALRLR